MASIPSWLPIIEGNSLLIDCVELGGNPKPRIEWLKDGVLLPTESASVEIKSNGSLLLKNCSQADAGLYTCKVREIHRTELSHTFTNFVNDVQAVNPMGNTTLTVHLISEFR